MKTASTEREAIVTEVAAKLTEAQRRAVRVARDPHGTPEGSAFHRRKAIGGWRTTNKLWEYGLADEDAYLTPLGLEVRSYIKDQDHGRA